jgi:hypothetical protein
MFMERRKKPRGKFWEVVDVEIAFVFYAETKEVAELYRKAVELVGHRSIVKEVVP